MGSVNDVKQFGNNRRTHAPYLSFPPIGSLLNLLPDESELPDGDYLIDEENNFMIEQNNINTLLIQED